MQSDTDRIDLDALAATVRRSKLVLEVSRAAVSPTGFGEFFVGSGGVFCLVFSKKEENGGFWNG